MIFRGFGVVVDNKRSDGPWVCRSMLIYRLIAVGGSRPLIFRTHPRIRINSGVDLQNNFQTLSVCKQIKNDISSACVLLLGQFDYPD